VEILPSLSLSFKKYYSLNVIGYETNTTPAPNLTPFLIFLFVHTFLIFGVYNFIPFSFTSFHSASLFTNIDKMLILCGFMPKYFHVH
jgi:hypothetical protein